MRPLLRSAVALAVGLGFAAVPATVLAAEAACGPGQHGLGIRLMDASVSRKDDPRARIYIDDFVNPSTTVIRHVEDSDCTGKPMHVQVYPVASSIEKDGWSVAQGHTPNELTSWTDVSPGTLDLAAHEAESVTVTIAVPADASSGERYATIVAELPPPKHGGTVSVANRVGVRVYLDVGAGGEPPSDFRVSTLTAERDVDGTPVVSAQVTNTGERAIDLTGELSLSDGPGGLRAGPFDVQTPRTLGIGGSGDVLVRLDGQTPAGPWLARLKLQSGFVSHTVTGRITFPKKSGAAATPVAAHQVDLAHNRNFLVPVAIGLILLALLGLLLLWWRRRKKDEDEDESGPTEGLRKRSTGSR